MKKTLILLFILTIFASCEKQYKCQRIFTKEINGVVVEKQYSEPYYVSEFSCNPCNYFEYSFKDTIFKSEIKCK
jgi:hypothetical protein